jgi:hypothetical protein
MGETYLVWSMEHCGWWHCQGHGYTAKLSEARGFSRADALKVCTEAIPGQAARHGYLPELPVACEDIENMQQVYHTDFPSLPTECWE